MRIKRIRVADKVVWVATAQAHGVIELTTSSHDVLEALDQCMRLERSLLVAFNPD